ncbi:DUF4326 domain-containing protein [Aerosakkonema sp. BLCC-F183]|uniref:DUF4326 domain-containing protein n=1 Tax=Aerosakkonema sp. BLCC-F183 TaxID=3342834 RepID=UPI0035B99343
MLKVSDGRITGFIGQDKIYVGRENKIHKLLRSPLANPYEIGKHGDRDQVIEVYRQWLWNQIKAWQQTGELNPVVEELFMICDRVKKGDRITLTCWCYPLACHGDVIVRCIRWMINQGY